MLYELFLKSLRGFKTSLLIPIILQNIIIALLVIFFLYFNGIMGMALDGQNITTTEAVEIFYANPAKLIASAAVLAIAAFLINSFFIGARLHLTRSIVKNAPMDVRAAFSYAKENIFRVLLLRIMQLSVVAGLAVFIAIIAFLISLTKSSVAVVASVVLLSLIGIIFAGLGLLFSYAIFFIMETPASAAITGSFRYFMSNKKMAVLTVFVIILVTVPSAFLNILEVLDIKVLSIAVMAIKIIYGIIVSAWNDLFIFNVYNSNKNPH